MEDAMQQLRYEIVGSFLIRHWKPENKLTLHHFTPTGLN